MGKSTLNKAESHLGSGRNAKKAIFKLQLSTILDSQNRWGPATDFGLRCYRFLPVYPVLILSGNNLIYEEQDKCARART